MDAAATFIILLWCRAVCLSPSRQSVSFFVVFSSGTQLLVDADEDDALLPHQNTTSGSSVGPTLQVFSSAPQDPGSPQLLVCLLTGLSSPQQDILWGVDDVVVRSEVTEGPWTNTTRGYSATSVWEVSAADWRSNRSSFWCGTVQGGRVYRQKLCSQTDC